MRSQISLISVVFFVSAIVSAVIKYGAPYLVSNQLSIADQNHIAFGAISLPVVIYAVILWQRK